MFEEAYEVGVGCCIVHDEACIDGDCCFEGMVWQGEVNCVGMATSARGGFV